MVSKQITFFLPKKTMNEATTYYVGIVKEVFKKGGYLVTETDEFNRLSNKKIIFVMSAKWCFLVKLRNPNAKIVTWFQGLGAEEALLTRESFLRKRLWNCVEWFALKFSWFNIYVSERMHQYYMDTYNLRDKYFFIMPCFNKKLNLSSFYVENKYSSPSFVYAGGLDKWQCIDETLEFYSLVERENYNSNLTLLTRDTVKAELLINKYNIKNYTIKFVSLEDLDSELEKFKYGFIIRKNHIVNDVSTPTKMNSYLANGVIPIYTDVISDFNREFGSKNFFLKLNSQETMSEWVNAFCLFDGAFESSNLEDLMLEIFNVFSSYYNQENYISSFVLYLNKFGDSLD